MNNFIAWIEKNIVPTAAKIGAQKHLSAIRDGFAALMPLVMAGAIAVMLNNVFFVPWGLVANFIGGEHPFIVWSNANIAPLFNAMDAGTLSILALALAFTLGVKRAEYEGKDTTSTGLINLSCFMLCGALARHNEVVASHVTNYLGSQGIFVALIIGLIAPEIYFWAVNKKLVIKLPDSVPPAVGKAFAAVIPGFITIFAWAVIYYVVNKLSGMSVFVWFETYISGSLMALGKSVVAVTIISLLIPLFWFFGLHGANLLEAVMSPIYGTLGLENISLFQNGVREVGLAQNQLAPWVRCSWDIYVFLGGSGATLALVVAILVASKVKQDREIAKLGLAPGIFEINEPVLFGLPVVLNPIYLIPFVLISPILTLIGYYATLLGFAGPVVNSIAWTTPPVLSAFIATNGSIGACIIAAVNLVIAFLIYLPFVMAANSTGASEE